MKNYSRMYYDRKTLIVFLFLSLFLCQIISCKKNNDEELPEEPENIQVDIYATGIRKENSINKPFYVHNNVAHSLPYSGNVAAIASDIFVSNDDVYVVGYVNRDASAMAQPAKAMLWKNSIPEELAIPNRATARALAVYVVASDVYVVGTISVAGRAIPTLWKNGEASTIGDGNLSAYPQDVMVVGNDVYIAGYENNSGSNTAVYWKNNVRYALSKPNVNTFSTGIFVDGADVYVAGYADAEFDQNAKYWKNGEEAVLPSGDIYSRTGAIAVDDGQVYVCGQVQQGENLMGRIWRNKEIMELQTPYGPARSASGMHVIKRNVYTVGAVRSETGNMPTLWVNGAVQEFGPFSTEFANINSIFVVEK
ncbi:hypothetical protein [Sphingobacterium corticibacter]|nr:hypothetical protein [Sphingobacterium corticibacter]